MTITNVVIALKIVTTATIPVPCPDGIDGCCVAHFENRVVDTHYEEFKVWDDDNKTPGRGMGFCLDDLGYSIEKFCCTAEAYGCTNNMPYPIRAYTKDGSGRFKMSHNIIGVFWPFEVFRAERDLLEK